MNSGIIAIGMSGGVDSSVAAYLLTKSWSRVVGVSHYIWKGSSCCNTETLQRARSTCDELGIPFFIIDLVDEFTRAVVDDFVDSYRHGETPNPCVRCNEFIRFGLFPRKIKDLLVTRGLMTQEESLYLSTGHYVRTREREGRILLRKGVDREKDQSYMLYHMDPDFLPLCNFPLGEMRKPEVVQLAKDHGFPTHSVKESQDVCFVNGKYIDFIKEYTGGELISQPGPIVNLAGSRIGTHRGYMNYTIGQRQGLGLSDGPWYVAELKAEENAVVVAGKKELGKMRFTLRRDSWFVPLSDSFRSAVKVRYNSGELSCSVNRNPEGTITVDLDEPTVLTPGQSAVFYEGEDVLGGGIIDL